MGDGMKRANLAALKTRGPWTGGHTNLPVWTLTGDEVVAYYEEMKRGNPNAEQILNDRSTGNRKLDRARTLLKKSGLIRHVKGTFPKWVTT